MSYGGREWGGEDRRSREVRRLGGRLAQVEEKVEKAARDGVGLGHSSFDNGAINQYQDGTLGSSFGQHFDGTNGAVTYNGPTPPTPAAPTITTASGGVNVRVDGTWDPVNDSTGRPIVAPNDFKGFEVHVARDNDFSTDDFDTVHGPLITSARGGDVFVPWGESGTPLYARIIARATTGKKSAPSKTAGPVNSGISMDNIGPAAPAQPVLESTTILTKEGIESGIVKATWTAPTLNENGTALTDLAGYLVQWRYTSQTDWYSTTTTATTLTLHGVVPGLQYELKVAAFDKTNNYSAWSPVASQIAVSNDAPPPKPNPPVVTNYLGQLRIEWGGLLNDNLPPVDFSHVRVYVSPTNGFTPSEVTRVADLGGAGVAYATAPYGSTYYVKLVAYDNRGNASVPSDQTSGSTKQVVSDDIFAGAVGSEKLADLAVVRAKIADLAVNNAKIADLSVGKLTAGTMSADVIVGGWIGTATSGARVGMDSSGFKKYRSDGTLAINLTATETLISGQFMTARTGRRIEMGVAGNTGLLEFISPENLRGFIKSYTEASQVDSIQIGFTAPSGNNYLWNRINLNEIGIHSYQAARHIMSVASNKTDGAGEWAVEFFPDQLVYDAVNPANHGGVRRLVVLNDLFQYRSYDDRIRFNIQSSANRVRFYPKGDGAGGGSFEIADNRGFNLQSAVTQFFQANGGGCSFASFDNRLEVQSIDKTVWHAHRALTHEAMSDLAHKSDIADADLDAVSAVKAMRIRKYKIKQPPPGVRATSRDVDQIGLIAQEVPDALPTLVTTPASDGTLGIDLYQYITVVAKAAQELIARVEALEGKTPPRPGSIKP